jgi:hypothetical protein
VRDLIVADGAVRGAVVERDGRRVTVRTRRGVVLACGGFRTTSNVARRCSRRRRPDRNTGRPALQATPATDCGWPNPLGGRIEDGLPNAAAWVPVSVTTRKDGSRGVMQHFIDRAKPGVIAVMRDGRRFANESNSYHDFVQEMMKAARPGEEIAAFLICDHRALRKYGLGCVPPFPMPIGDYLGSGYLNRGEPCRTCGAGRGRCQSARSHDRAIQCRRG